MINYSAEELLEKIDASVKEASSSGKIDQQSIVLVRFLTDIKKAIEKDKEVSVKNITREITKPIGIKRPDWIKELKTDNSSLEKALSSVVQAIEMKEVVRKVELKEASWLKKALKRNEPVQTDYSKLLKDILAATKKEVKYPTKMDIKGSVHVSNTLSVGKPSWYNPITYTDQLSSILRALKTPFHVTLTEPVKLEKDTLDVKVNEGVTVNNPKFEVFIKDSSGRIVDFDKQFGRINAAPGSTGGVSNADVVTAIGNITVPASTDTNYETRILADSVDANFTYSGKAAIDSVTSGSVWQIQKMDETTGLVIEWADGDDSFDNVWDDRESLSYS